MSYPIDMDDEFLSDFFDEDDDYDPLSPDEEWALAEQGAEDWELQE